MKKSLTIIIVLALIVCALCAYAVLTLRTVLDSGVRIANLTAQVTANDVARQALHSAQTSASSLSPDITATDSYIIAPDGTADFIDQVESLAKSDTLAVTVDSVNVQSTNALSAAKLEYLQLDVTVSGSWATVYQFAAEVENLPYDISINQADFSDVTDTGTKGAAVWQGAFQLSVVKNISPDESH